MTDDQYFLVALSRLTSDTFGIGAVALSLSYGALTRAKKSETAVCVYFLVLSADHVMFGRP